MWGWLVPAMLMSTAYGPTVWCTYCMATNSCYKITSFLKNRHNKGSCSALFQTPSPSTKQAAFSKTASFWKELQYCIDQPGWTLQFLFLIVTGQHSQHVFVQWPTSYMKTWKQINNISGMYQQEETKWLGLFPCLTHAALHTGNTKQHALHPWVIFRTFLNSRVKELQRFWARMVQNACPACLKEMSPMFCQNVTRLCLLWLVAFHFNGRSSSKAIFKDFSFFILFSFQASIYASSIR